MTGDSEPGFSGLRGQKPNGMVNLLDYLLEEHLAVFKAGTGQQPPEERIAQMRRLVSDFKVLLKENPPIGTSYVDMGVCLRLQSGVVVRLMDPDESGQMAGPQAVSISQPRSQPGQNGIVDAGAVDITGAAKQG